MSKRALDPAELQTNALTGRPFLHEQGQLVCRGFVDSLNVDGEQWELVVRDIERLDKMTSQWCLDVRTDTYGGPLEMHFSLEQDTISGIITLSGYGMEVHIGPATSDPWRGTDWPELDGYAGGPMA